MLAHSKVINGHYNIDLYNYIATVSYYKYISSSKNYIPNNTYNKKTIKQIVNSIVFPHISELIMFRKVKFDDSVIKTINNVYDKFIQNIINISDFEEL